MARFIELTYYTHNKTFPEKSGSANKKFLLNTDDVSEVVPYENSTKIIKKYTGIVVEVCETYDAVLRKMKGS